MTAQTSASSRGTPTELRATAREMQAAPSARGGAITHARRSPRIEEALRDRRMSYGVASPADRPSASAATDAGNGVVPERVARRPEGDTHRSAYVVPFGRPYDPARL